MWIARGLRWVGKGCEGCGWWWPAGVGFVECQWRCSQLAVFSFSRSVCLQTNQKGCAPRTRLEEGQRRLAWVRKNDGSEACGAAQAWLRGVVCQEQNPCATAGWRLSCSMRCARSSGVCSCHVLAAVLGLWWVVGRLLARHVCVVVLASVFPSGFMQMFC